MVALHKHLHELEGDLIGKDQDTLTKRQLDRGRFLKLPRVKQQLEETSEIRSDVEHLDQEIKEAQTLCDELSVLIGEQYLKDELKKRLETVALPLQGLEDLAGELR